MKLWVFRLAGFGVLLGIAATLMVISGVVSIKASSGHWPITEWFLHFAMKRSVVTHSLALEAPLLDDPALILKGATHYETGCRSCHGSPELQHPRVAQHMTPAPPYLETKIAEWKPEQLFYVVKHGVKFTGMPAWPAPHRDDEIWAMVAFLQKFPQLNAAEYRRLALGKEDAPAESEPMRRISGSETLSVTLRESCVRCHGADGGGRGTAFPKLAAQRPAYLRHALTAYASGARHSGIMEPIAAGLDAKTIRELVDHYSSQRATPRVSHTADSAAIARGEGIAQRGIPSQRVPSCVDCHGPNPTRLNPAYPVHAGQHADYLVLQLELFKTGHRGGSPYARLMRPIAGRLTPEQMRDVSLYYESLSPPPENPKP